MSTPQPGLFAAAGPLHIALEFDAPALDSAALGAARRALADYADSAVVALGARAYGRLGGAAAARPLAEIGGVANTPRDVLVWLRDTARDRLFDAARAVDAALGGELALEIPGFDYRDSRDLTGFVDGTANPKGAAARGAALVPENMPGAGGAYVLTQRWRHDLAAFFALPVAEQERVIGRTKAGDVELSGAAMPAHGACRPSRRGPRRGSPDHLSPQFPVGRSIGAWPLFPRLLARCGTVRVSAAAHVRPGQGRRARPAHGFLGSGDGRALVRAVA